MRRRLFLSCTSMLLAGAMAGCTDDSTETDDDPRGYEVEFTDT